MTMTVVSFYKTSSTLIKKIEEKVSMNKEKSIILRMLQVPESIDYIIGSCRIAAIIIANCININKNKYVGLNKRNCKIW